MEVVASLAALEALGSRVLSEVERLPPQPRELSAEYRTLQVNITKVSILILRLERAIPNSHSLAGQAEAPIQAIMESLSKYETLLAKLNPKSPAGRMRIVWKIPKSLVQLRELHYDMERAIDELLLLW